MINNFPNEKEAMIGYLEAMMGFGVIIGPLIGSALFEIFGFAITFYFVGVTMCLFSLYTKFNLHETNKS